MPIENQHQLLDDIDARQNEVLDQLDALNREIECTIESIVGVRDGAGEPGLSTALSVHADNAEHVSLNGNTDELEESAKKRKISTGGDGLRTDSGIADAA